MLASGQGQAVAVVVVVLVLVVSVSVEVEVEVVDVFLSAGFLGTAQALASAAVMSTHTENRLPFMGSSVDAGRIA
jgi:hypothetical protein